ncbi:MAG TPA: Mo-dependent nitrogenase C-terminal domain-containing protein [Allocoleopsis sp.]
MNTSSALRPPKHAAPFDLLKPIRQWLEKLPVEDAKTAHRIAKLIPAQCPFERDIKVLGRTVAHIPPLCKLNPFYEQFVSLRFRALCYLADVCGEDIRQYC